jgi:hypothetical protein
VGHAPAARRGAVAAVPSAVRLVTATTADNPAFEKGRLERILKWKAERLAAAKLFKTTAARSLPIAPQYRVRVQEIDERVDVNERCKLDWLCRMRGVVERARKDPAAAKTHAAALARAAGLLARGLTELHPVQAVARDRRRIPVVDGVCTPSINGCFDDGCYEQFPLPGPGVVGFLHNAQLGVLDVTSAPALADVTSSRSRAASCPSRPTPPRPRAS